LKKTLGRLAGAVLAGALISLTVVPAANAEDTPDTSSSVPAPADNPASATPSASDTPTAPPTSTSDTAPPETTKPSEPGQTTTPGKPTETKPTEPTQPTTTTSTSGETTPPEPPYEDDTAYGIDLPDSYGLLLIACAAGAPTNLHSKDFDLVDGPVQDETDGRYWSWTVKRHEGVSFDAGTVYADWTCGGKPTEGEKVPPAGGAGAGSAGTADKHGDSQVKYTPKRGIETGFGGMAA
jgi:hypothetical protein